MKKQEVILTFSQDEVTYAGVLELLKPNKDNNSVGFIYTDLYTMNKVCAIVNHFNLNDNTRLWFKSKGSKESRVIIVNRKLGNSEFNRVTKFWTKLKNNIEDIENYLKKELKQ